ncbi:MAG: shikimate kinase [Phycisphaeraceae bacterium]|nr:shikimate kinase [Phycisphaeraceae bacterium]MBX3405835.1 shikimate kinase [Phycisphaeraceae bacterium]
MMPEAANLLLIGLRGSGKSTIGRMLAARLGREFVDLDNTTAALLNCRTPGEAFAAHGESVFRIAENRALINESVIGGRVIALGGGTPTAPGVAQMLEGDRSAGRAVIVYLRVMPDVLRARLRATDTSTRPSLTGTGTLEEIESVFAARDPVYRRLATHVIEAAAEENPHAGHIAQRIERLIR